MICLMLYLIIYKYKRYIDYDKSLNIDTQLYKDGIYLNNE